MSSSEWIEFRLAEICDYKTGRLNSNAADENGKYPFFTCSPEIFRVNSYSFNQEAILLAGNNANGIFNIKLFKGKFDAYQRTYVISTKNEEILNNKFLYYYLGLQLNYLKQLSVGSATKFLTKTILDNIIIKVPNDKFEMRKIAYILSSIDEKIEINNQINKKLEKMSQAIFKQWFVDFEFLNEDGEPYKSSGGEMVESEFGMIPKGWRIKTLGELCDIVTKSEKPFENPEKIYEHFSLPACDEGKLPVIEMGKNINSNKYKINNDCILISKLNPSTKRIWDPLCNSENAICSTEFIAFKPYDKDIKPFCYEVINCDKFTEFLLSNVTGSTGSRQRVKPKNTLNFKVLVAETNIIEAFCNVIKSIHQKIKLNIQEGKKLKDTRDTLLPKLISGEIRVSIESN